MSTHEIINNFSDLTILSQSELVRMGKYQLVEDETDLYMILTKT